MPIDVYYVCCTTVICDYSHWVDKDNFHGAECPNCGGVLEYSATYEFDLAAKKAKRV